MDDTVVVEDPNGQRWGIETWIPGTLDGVTGGGRRRIGFLVSGVAAASRGWCVVVYRIDNHRWVGPWYREEVKDEAAASAASQRIAQAIRSGASRPWA